MKQFILTSRVADLVVAPRSSTSSPGTDSATELLSFFTRKVVSTVSFQRVLDGCLSIRFVSACQRVMPLFCSSSPTSSKTEPNQAVILPKLSPALAVIVSDSLAPDSLASSLQEIGRIDAVDRMMFEIFTGSANSLGDS